MRRAARIEKKEMRKTNRRKRMVLLDTSNPSCERRRSVVVACADPCQCRSDTSVEMLDGKDMGEVASWSPSLEASKSDGLQRRWEQHERELGFNEVMLGYGLDFAGDMVDPEGSLLEGLQG